LYERLAAVHALSLSVRQLTNFSAAVVNGQIINVTGEDDVVCIRRARSSRARHSVMPATPPVALRYRIRRRFFSITSVPPSRTARALGAAAATPAGQRVG